MRSILSLINKYFWKGIIGPVFAYLVPCILVLFIGRIMAAAFIIPGVFVIPLLSVLLVFMPQSIFEFRNSSLLKRIGTTPIKPWKFLFGISIFNIFIVVTGFLVVFLFSFAVFADNLNKDAGEGTIPSFMTLINSANWGVYIYFTMIVILMGIVIGLFLASIARSTLFIQCTGISLLLIVMFVGPCILPISLIASVDVVRYLGYLVPFKYPINSAIEAFTSNLPGSIINLNGSNPFDIYVSYKAYNVMSALSAATGQTEELINIYEPVKVNKLLNLIMPWIFILLFSYLVAASFRWNNRGKCKFNWNIFKELKNIIAQRKNQPRIQFHKFKWNQFIKIFFNDQHQFHLPNKQKIKDFIYGDTANLIHRADDNNDNILEVNHISRVFKTRDGELIANNDITFALKKGRNLAILGHNGAGKSVLVETIVGVNPIQKGEIIYNFEYKKSFKEKIGIQFQDSLYPFGLRVKDIILFFIKAYKLKMSNEHLNKLLNIFGVNSFYNKNAGSLSGGQQQRINLLLAVLHNPKIIFLDELSTGLDIKIRREICNFIKTYAKQNHMSIIIVSHDMNEVLEMADDILILKNGEVQFFGSKQQVFKKKQSFEKFVYQYL